MNPQLMTTHPKSSASTFIVRFADTQVSVAVDGARGRQILMFLFGVDSIQTAPSQAAPDYTLACEESPDKTTLYKGSRIRYKGSKEGVAAGILLDRVMYDLADRCHGGLMLHAAATSWQGEGILLPGNSGAGKSTLSSWLTSCKFDYLSDELVYIPNNCNILHGLNRPLHLKKPLSFALKNKALAYTESHTQNFDFYDSDRGLLVPIEAFNSRSVYSAPEITLIVFSEYDPKADPSLQKLSAANAAMHLMGCLINARNLPGHNLPEVSRIAKQIPAYKLVYKRLDAVGDIIISLLDELRRQP